MPSVNAQKASSLKVISFWQFKGMYVKNVKKTHVESGQ